MRKCPSINCCDQDSQNRLHRQGGRDPEHVQVPQESSPEARKNEQGLQQYGWTCCKTTSSSGGPVRRNFDTKAGQVKGAIRTVVAIASYHSEVKFDHLRETFNVEKVKGKFMVMKNYTNH